MNSNEAAELYQEFLDFRSKLLNDACKNAWFTDIKKGQKVRPIVPLTTEKDLREFNKQVAKWHEYVERLVTLDPVRFDAKATIFNPAPRLVNKPKRVRLIINRATSVRDRSREDIINHLKKHLNKIKERAHHGDRDRVIIDLEREIAFFEAETEEKYRIRNAAYNDLITIISYGVDRDGREIIEKVRVPHAGLFVYDPNYRSQIPGQETWLFGKKQSKKVGAIEFYGVKPVPCSLPFSGKMYRALDLDLAVAAFAGDKVAEAKLQERLASRNSKGQARG